MRHAQTLRPSTRLPHFQGSLGLQRRLNMAVHGNDEVGSVSLLQFPFYHQPGDRGNPVLKDARCRLTSKTYAACRISPLPD